MTERDNNLLIEYVTKKEIKEIQKRLIGLPLMYRVLDNNGKER